MTVRGDYPPGATLHPGTKDRRLSTPHVAVEHGLSMRERLNETPRHRACIAGSSGKRGVWHSPETGITKAAWKQDALVITEEKNMRTKTYEVEVVRTSQVRVTLPETMSGPEFIKEWESGLWDLENGEASVAEFAARMAVEYPEGNHDGVGKMITSGWQKPDCVANHAQVVAIVVDDSTETEVTHQGDWQEVEAKEIQP